MKKLVFKSLIPFCMLCLLISTLANAQEKTLTNQDSVAQEVLTKLANPAAAIGAMISLFDFQVYDGDLTDSPNSKQTGFRYTFQPSLPVPLKNGVNMFIRPLIPINLRQPVYESDGFKNAGVDLGDISLDWALGKTFNKKWLIVGGAYASIPTATDDRIGFKQVLLGPEFAYGRVGKWGSAVLLLTYGWSITNNDTRGNTEVLGGQYMYNFNIGNAWQISGNPTFSYIPNASSGNKWLFPIGGGVKKVKVVGRTAVAFGLQYYYYVVRPETFGSVHQIRLMIAPIVPLPW